MSTKKKQDKTLRNYMIGVTVFFGGLSIGLLFTEAKPVAAITTPLAIVAGRAAVKTNSNNVHDWY